MKDKRSIGVMIIIVALVGFAFWSGYAAERKGENRDLIGAFFVCIGFLGLAAGIWVVHFMWQKVTDAPAGVSAWRYLLGAVGGLISSIIMYAFFVHEAKSSNSFSLGVVAAVTVGACWLVWRLISHSTPGEAHDENGSISFFDKEEVSS